MARKSAAARSREMRERRKAERAAEERLLERLIARAGTATVADLDDDSILALHRAARRWPDSPILNEMRGAIDDDYRRRGFR